MTPTTFKDGGASHLSGNEMITNGIGLLFLTQSAVATTNFRFREGYICPVFLSFNNNSITQQYSLGAFKNYYIHLHQFSAFIMPLRWANVEHSDEFNWRHPFVTLATV